LREKNRLKIKRGGRNILRLIYEEKWWWLGEKIGMDEESEGIWWDSGFEGNKKKDNQKKRQNMK
jgi:hypothetical protein